MREWWGGAARGIAGKVRPSRTTRLPDADVIHLAAQDLPHVRSDGSNVRDPLDSSRVRVPRPGVGRGRTKSFEGNAPYPMGATVPITTHGTTFSLTAMADLNEQGTATSTREGRSEASIGLWRHVRESGELQELAVPVVGTGRGGVSVSREQMIRLIADSFTRATREGRFADKLIIVVRPADAERWKLDLHDIKDSSNHILNASAVIATPRRRLSWRRASGSRTRLGAHRGLRRCRRRHSVAAARPGSVTGGIQAPTQPESPPRPRFHDADVDETLHTACGWPSRAT